MLHRDLVGKQRTKYGLIVNYQWVKGEPALCLMRKRFDNNSAYVICLSSAYKYAEVNYLMGASMQAAAQLGMHGERYAARNIADIILEGLEDLVKMKPEPIEMELLREGKRPETEWDGVNRILTLH